MTPCIISTLTPGKFGYCRKKYKGKKVPHHRLAYAKHHGLDVFTMVGVVMHACDVRNCINPEHLSLGTHKANTLDMLQKGRCTQAKLSSADVQYIRDNFTSHPNSNAVMLAKQFGVKRCQIYRIVRHTQHTWIQVQA